VVVAVDVSSGTAVVSWTMSLSVSLMLEDTDDMTEDIEDVTSGIDGALVGMIFCMKPPRKLRRVVDVGASELEAGLVSIAASLVVVWALDAEVPRLDLVDVVEGTNTSVMMLMKPRWVLDEAVGDSLVGSSEDVDVSVIEAVYCSGDIGLLARVSRKPRVSLADALSTVALVSLGTSKAVLLKTSDVVSRKIASEVWLRILKVVSLDASKVVSLSTSELVSLNVAELVDVETADLRGLKASVIIA